MASGQPGPCSIVTTGSPWLTSARVSGSTRPLPFSACDTVVGDAGGLRDVADGGSADHESWGAQVCWTGASPPGDQSFGHAQAIGVTGDGLLAAAADPRAGDGGVAGY